MSIKTFIVFLRLSMGCYLTNHELINKRMLSCLKLSREIVVETRYAVAIRTGTVRRVWFAIRTAMGIFLANVGEIFVFFDFYNLTSIKQG